MLDLRAVCKPKLLSIKRRKRKVWTSVTANLESLNAKFNATYYWTSDDSSTCRRSLTAADSGAYETSRETFYIVCILNHPTIFNPSTEIVII
ncbi:MAG: hypothetical protein IPK10_18425 [Bacteroidetes bacterium]|nr:hypothetical protein [Bacteroidota bacterium]